MMRAIELNGVAIDLNKRAFMLGRLAAADMKAVERLAQPQQVIQFAQPKSLEEMIALRVKLLTDYQDSRYADRYVALVRLVEQKERALEGEGSKLALSKAVARSLYKAMAYKDEYEVARLHADPAFRTQIADQFDGEFKIPTAADVPELTTLLMESPTGPAPFEGKAIAEIPNVPTAAAIANAIADAVGVRLFDLPLTSEKVYAELNK